MLSNEQLQERAKRIRYFFCDVDGTLTDGITYYSEVGEAFKRFSHIDGAGFQILKNLSIEVGIITGENSQIVLRRAEKLRVAHCFLNVKDKLHLLKQFAIKHGFALDELAYIGDDLNDLELIRSSGISFVPANARELCKASASVILRNDGGDGALREAVDLLTELRGECIWEVFNRNK